MKSLLEAHFFDDGCFKGCGTFRRQGLVRRSGPTSRPAHALLLQIPECRCNASISLAPASPPPCLPATCASHTAGGCSFSKSKQALLSLKDNSLNLHKLKYHLKIKHNKGLEVKADQAKIWRELHLRPNCVSNSMTLASDLGLHSTTLQAYRRTVMPAKDGHMPSVCPFPALVADPPHPVFQSLAPRVDR